MNFFGIGGLELVIIALVAFLVLGPRKMAEAGKTVARVMSELKKQRDELTQVLLIEPEGDSKKRAALSDATSVPQDQPVEHASSGAAPARPSAERKPPDNTES